LVKVGFPPGAVFERRPGDRDADSHRLQGARAPLFRRHDRCAGGIGARYGQRVVQIGQSEPTPGQRRSALSTAAPMPPGFAPRSMPGLDVVGLLYAT